MNKNQSTSQNEGFVSFPLGKKNYHWQKCLKIDKKAFPLARKCVSTSQNAFKNTFWLDQKKLSLTEMSKNQIKKRFHQSKMCLKIRFPLAKKTMNDRNVSEIDKRSISTSQKMRSHQSENAFPLARMRFKKRFCRAEKQSQQWQEYLKLEEKMVFTSQKISFYQQE